MAKKKKIIIAKDDWFDDVDSDFKFADDNFDMIVRELDIVNEYLRKEEQLQVNRVAQRRYVAENREIVNQRQRDLRQQDPERIRKYNKRRDKAASLARARKWYKSHAEQERERQRIIREKRRAKQAEIQVDDNVTKTEKIKSGTKVLKDKNAAMLKALQSDNEKA